MKKQHKPIGFFEKYLTLWVALCITAGIAIGHFTGDSISFLSDLEIYRVNLPVAVLIWLIKPFTMAFLHGYSLPSSMLLSFHQNKQASTSPEPFF